MTIILSCSEASPKDFQPKENLSRKSVIPQPSKESSVQALQSKFIPTLFTGFLLQKEVTRQEKTPEYKLYWQVILQQDIL